MFCQKLSNCHISLWRKVFFSIFNQFFFSLLSKLPNVARGHQQNKRTQSLIGDMVVGRFPKKIRNKTFYFHCKKKFHLFLFLLSFGPRVHFRSQKSTFWSNHPEYKCSAKNCQIVIFHSREKFFFPFLTNFFFIHIKVAQCCEGSPKKYKNPVAYWKHGS
jgi:hypothetical protein